MSTEDACLHKVIFYVYFASSAVCVRIPKGLALTYAAAPKFLGRKCCAQCFERRGLHKGCSTKTGGSQTPLEVLVGIGHQH